MIPREYRVTCGQLLCIIISLAVLLPEDLWPRASIVLLSPPLSSPYASWRIHSNRWCGHAQSLALVAVQVISRCGKW